MADLKDLINEIDINDMNFQLLMQGNTELKVKGRKDKYLEVKFETNAEYINQDKEAVIIWVDRQKLNAALNKVQSK